MTAPTLVTGNTTGVNYRLGPISPQHIHLQHDADSVPPYQPRSSHESLSPSMSEGNVTHSQLMPINTSYIRSTPYTEISHNYFPRSPTMSISRRRAASVNGLPIGNGTDLPDFQQHHTPEPFERLQIGDYDHRLSMAAYSDSPNSGSQSNDDDQTPSTTLSNEPHVSRHNRQKRRRQARTTDTLITEKSARDKLALAFDMLRQALPEDIRSMRCGRAIFLGEASEWVQNIQVSYNQLQRENQELRGMNQSLQNDNRMFREMLQNCSCGAVRPQSTPDSFTSHQDPSPAYYNPGDSYVPVHQY